MVKATEEPPTAAADVSKWHGSKSHGPVAHRPQELVFSFFGGVVHGRELPPIPTSVFLRLLGDLGVAEAAARATLARMTARGLLERSQVGRTAHFRLSEIGSDVVTKATERVSSPMPFEHPEGQWTLLSYSMPESRRDLRHRMRLVLTWAGFGGLRDGLWIAPGLVDVGEVLAEAGLDEVVDLAEWFSATPLPGVRTEELIERAWDVSQIRAQHERFVDAWDPSRAPRSPLSDITLLGADWIQLLRVDPGLPARFLAADWPAEESVVVYQRRYGDLLPAAKEQLDAQLGL